ncbi:MAG: hypothetical protein PHH77_01095 [Victivallaceae bacterium]|nr:hypothetical protein [Victivallaceae bacterium]
MNEELTWGETEFSWSLSRDHLFSFCPRAYFYHYYGAAGGFEFGSGTELLYRLKKLQKLELWLTALCTAVLRGFFYENPENFNFRLAARRNFRRGMRSVSLREWRADPQQLNLFELYYGLEEINALTERGAQLLNTWIDQLIESGLTDYLGKIPYLERKTFSFPAAAYVGKIKTWLAPAVIWQEDGRLKFLTLNNGRTDPVRLHHAAALHKIYAFNKLRIAPERVVTLNFDLTCGETTGISAAAVNVSELIAYVKASAAGMLAAATGRDTVSEADFPRSPGNCPECRFRKYCETATENVENG